MNRNGHTMMMNFTTIKLMRHTMSSEVKKHRKAKSTLSLLTPWKTNLSLMHPLKLKMIDIVY